MKKESIITAVVFFGVGFLAGYSTFSYFTPKGASAPAAVASSNSVPTSQGAPTPSAASTDASAQLPPGHPPLDVAATIQSFQQQAAQNPKDAESALKLADFLYDQKRFSEAITSYQKALALDPKNVNAHTDLGTAYFNIGKAVDAIHEYRKSLAINPHHEPTLYNMILVNLEGTRDLAAARQAYDRLRKENPNCQGLEDLKRRLDSAATSPAPTSR